MSKIEAIEKVESQVQARLAGRVRNFRVELADHGLVLRGFSESYYAKQLAQHAVMQATPLRIVANEIQVV